MEQPIPLTSLPPAGATLKGKTIVLGVTGSIAAYKAADLISLLTKRGASVFPIMTEGATRIVTPLTLQVLARNPCSVDMWSEGGWQPDHISLADRADLLLVAPATANSLAQFAHGLAPDLLSSIYLATPAPVMHAPAMNGKMLLHPATRHNLGILRERGDLFVEPATGVLACGYEGQGKLASVETIVAAVENFFASPESGNRRSPR
jgi:phosphopantothenoylcysteine decarboxylase